MGCPINCTGSELSIFLAGLAEGYFPIFYSDTNPSAPSKSISIASKSCQQGKRTVHFPGFQFSMTLQNSTEDRGEDLLTLYQVVSPAKTSALPEKAQGLTVNDPAYGRKCTASLAKYDPGSRTWKTAQQSLIADWDECLEIWPTAGMTAGMEFYQQPRLEQGINVTAGGALPDEEKFATPTTMDSLPPKSEQALLKEMTVARPGRSKPANLRDQVSNMDKWKMWPAPTARDYKDGSFTPETKAKRDEHSRGKPLSEVIGGRLNPDWVESYLMLWPRGWTALEPLPDDAWYSMQPHDEPDNLPRVTSNCPNRAARLKAIGNGQVPKTAMTAWILLMDRFGAEP